MLLLSRTVWPGTPWSKANFRRVQGWLLSLIKNTASVLLGIVFSCQLNVVNAEQKLLRFAGLIDGTGEVIKGREILIDDGLIVAVGESLEACYPDAKKIYHDKLTALPGMIDVHVHMTYGLSEPSKGDAWTQLFSTTAPERLVEAKRNARRTLASGVTTARDLFAFGGVDFQLKALIDDGIVPGPRLFLSGEAIHPSVLPIQREGVQDYNVAALRKQTRVRLDKGADWIKIFATTGSADDLSGEQIFFYPQIKAVTEMAHAAGRRVAVHSYSASAVVDALKAGVDSIEHPVGVSDEILRQWATTKTVYVPTIDHNRYYAEHRDEYGYDETVEKQLYAFVQRNVDTLRRAHAAGVVIAMGSDAVMTGFGQNLRELEWFIKAGMSKQEAIQTATINAASLLGQKDNLGRLRVGFAADIIGVEGDPLVDIRALTRNVAWVMKAGEIVIDDQAD